MNISNCKINLGLNILNKREDGYHELDMVMAPIFFGDDMQITCLDNDGNLEFTIKNNLIPIDQSNTVTKAYNYYFENKIQKEVIVYLEKKIPRQAGLGGGSSNAAYLLKALNEVYKYYSNSEMIGIAKKVGADVPFFLFNKTSRVKGIGENVEIINNNIKNKILLLKHNNIGISTKIAFSYYTSNTRELKYSNLDKVVEGLNNGNLNLLENNIENTLEQLVLSNNQKLLKFKDEMEQIFNQKIFMSGSGSTFFTFIENDKLNEIKEIREKLLNNKIFVYITNFYQS